MKNGGVQPAGRRNSPAALPPTSVAAIPSAGGDAHDEVAVTDLVSGIRGETQSRPLCRRSLPGLQGEEVAAREPYRAISRRPRATFRRSAPTPWANQNRRSPNRSRTESEGEEEGTRAGESSPGTTVTGSETATVTPTSTSVGTIDEPTGTGTEGETSEDECE